MNSITNKISTMLSLATDDMVVFVVNNEKLSADIRKGWPNRVVKDISSDDVVMSWKRLVIMGGDSFYISF